MADTTRSMFDPKTIMEAQRSNMQSQWARSYFSILNFLTEMGRSSPIPQTLGKLNLVRTTNYRQELDLHNKTHELSYSDVQGHNCAHDPLAANASELLRYKDNPETREAILPILFKDQKKAQNFWKGISEHLDSLLGVAKRFFGAMLKINKSSGFTSPDYENAKNPKPFASMGEEEFKRKVREFFSNSRVTTEIRNLGAPIPTVDIIAERLWEGATKHLVVISHDYPQDKDTNENRWEAILACLLVYLWEDEKIRVESGIGVVTPYRNQEARIRNLYISAFPDSLLRKEATSWCATPERFQGRDLSRCVFSTASEQDSVYL